MTSPRVTLVAGPPGAGKSSWVADQRAAIGGGGMVYDYDALMAAVTGRPWWERTPAGHHVVLAIRDLLGDVFARLPDQVWWITSAPCRDERQAWRDAGARVVVVVASVDVCVARCASRPTPDVWPAAIATWWDRYQADPADEIVRTDG